MKAVGINATELREINYHQSFEATSTFGVMRTFDFQRGDLNLIRPAVHCDDECCLDVHRQGTISRVQYYRWNRCCIDFLYLTDYYVINVTQDSAGGQVVVEPIETETAYPFCAELITRIQVRSMHWIMGFPAGGGVLQVLVRKLRMACQVPPSDSSYDFRIKELPTR